MTRMKRSDAVLSLPARPNLEYLKNQAKQRLEDLRKTDPQARLSAAQSALARDYGFSGWRALSAQVAAPAIDGVVDAVAARRVEQAMPRLSIAVESKILETYKGEYLLGPDAVLTVTVQAEQIFVQLTGQPAVALLAESPAKFFCKTLPLQVSFQADAQDHVTGLILHQNGWEKPAPRIAPAEAERIAKSLARRVTDGSPLAGSEPALRHQIEVMVQRDGCPDYAEMTEELAEVSRTQRSALQWQFRQLGGLQALIFMGLGAQGWDVYQARFAQGMLLARIRLDDAGKIAGLMLQNGP